MFSESVYAEILVWNLSYYKYIWPQTSGRSITHAITLETLHVQITDVPWYDNSARPFK